MDIWTSPQKLIPCYLLILPFWRFMSLSDVDCWVVGLQFLAFTLGESVSFPLLSFSTSTPHLKKTKTMKKHNLPTIVEVQTCSYISSRGLGSSDLVVTLGACLSSYNRSPDPVITLAVCLSRYSRSPDLVVTLAVYLSSTSTRYVNLFLVFEVLKSSFV